jgi:hypothetical protein
MGFIMTSSSSPVNCTPTGYFNDDLVGGVVPGAKQGAMLLYDAARHPVDKVLLPIGSLINDVRLVHACHEIKTNPTSYIARNNTIDECQPAVDRMLDRTYALKTFVNDFGNASNRKKTEILTAIAVTSLVPGTILRGGAQMASNYYRLGILTNPLKFRNLSPIDLTKLNKVEVKNATISLKEFRALSGDSYHKFVVTPEGRLIISKTFSPEKKWYKHADYVDGKRVILAGTIAGKDGLIRYMYDMSGHYNPYGPQLKHIANRVFVRNGYKEAKNKFDYVMSISEGVSKEAAKYATRERLFKIVPTPVTSLTMVAGSLPSLLGKDHFNTDLFNEILSQRLHSEQNDNSRLRPNLKNASPTEESLPSTPPTGARFPDINMQVSMDNPKKAGVGLSVPLDDTTQFGALVPITSPQNSSLTASTDIMGAQCGVLINPTNMKESSVSVLGNIGKTANLGVGFNPSNPKRPQILGSVGMGTANVGCAVDPRRLQNSTVSVAVPVYGVPVEVNARLNNLKKTSLFVGYPGTPLQASISVEKLRKALAHPDRAISRLGKKIEKGFRRLFGKKKRKKQAAQVQPAPVDFNALIRQVTAAAQACYNAAQQRWMIATSKSFEEYLSDLIDDWSVSKTGMDFTQFPGIIYQELQRGNFVAVRYLSPRAHSAEAVAPPEVVDAFRAIDESNVALTAARENLETASETDLLVSQKLTRTIDARKETSDHLDSFLTTNQDRIRRALQARLAARKG